VFPSRHRPRIIARQQAAPYEEAFSKRRRTRVATAAMAWGSSALAARNMTASCLGA
jgi:hypothetical protein